MNGHLNGNGHAKLDQLPPEMFSIIKSAGSYAPRLGRLALPNKRIVATPHYLANTSRGVVPHITQDTFTRDTDISAVYVALEDFIEKIPKATPPLYNFQPPNGESPLRRFIALPRDPLLVLGARRAAPVGAPDATSNTNSAVAVCTSTGFRHLDADSYAEEAERLRPDILVVLGDIPYGKALGNKRIEKATDRNIQWLDDHISIRNTMSKPSQTKLFASLLPVTCAKQQYFVDEVAGKFSEHVSGLSVYSVDSLDDLPKDLDPLPRLGFTEPKTPQDILYQIRRGLDVLVIPFVGAATDAGIALDFGFGSQSISTTNGESTTNPLPLGIDMWPAIHATDLSPLTPNCTCYACTNHHRAYIQHLLSAKEMLGWILLQIHNHHIMDLFFASIRDSIANDSFEHDVQAFERKYESRLPAKTGQGPRVRGYQYKSEGPGEAKKNPNAFRVLDDGKEKLKEAKEDVMPEVNKVEAEELQERGFAEKE
ncbi:Queuine tRNA-ribosyltransferase accessory subunit 2 [Pseudocercospora fuligena]|uniref:Queuine tRNA-ribosyltransferase accessory subunit 2 n=1 Tax=Pseudocercospora fuligena TaxID=685502 RepID=A0A8H6VHI3_9PEZI|nr:Queuine tRNA-ribosyltransferase accessory subunit 2 [Pseudocercospora fuligena]